LPAAAEAEVERELLREKVIVEDKRLPISGCNYSALRVQPAGLLLRRAKDVQRLGIKLTWQPLPPDRLGSCDTARTTIRLDSTSRPYSSTSWPTPHTQG
jgi:hypothetical protein